MCLYKNHLNRRKIHSAYTRVKEKTLKYIKIESRACITVILQRKYKRQRYFIKKRNTRLIICLLK